MHACGLTEAQAVECWGLGSDSSEEGGYSDHDQGIAPGGVYKAVATGTFHTCGIVDSGQVKCWGQGEDADKDEQGYMDFDQSVPASGAFREVAAGDYHTCGITTADTVKCWGVGTDPDADEAPRRPSVDADQATPPDGSFETIAAGRAHTCGFTKSGGIECWGADEVGQASPPELE